MRKVEIHVFKGSLKLCVFYRYCKCKQLFIDPVLLHLYPLPSYTAVYIDILSKYRCADKVVYFPF